jgi:hypothetical protein
MPTASVIKVTVVKRGALLSLLKTSRNYSKICAMRQPLRARSRRLPRR